MVKKYKFYFFWFIWFLLVSFIFNKYAYEIDQFNASTRVFIKHRTLEVRQFDENGIPLSRSAKYKEGFISPFYVVHYGLLYSMEYEDRYTGIHWKFNKTHELWNVPPPKIEPEYFKNSADWVVENIENLNGQYHLVYHFDWVYKGYPNNMLKAPWYSGLTDGYALLLLLRAYDVYQDKKYLNGADKLYKAVSTPYESGGALTSLAQHPWIEEYVQPSLEADEMAYVFNGMVYATYGVLAYEQFMGKPYLSKALLTSINLNVTQFGSGCWSEYDLIGTTANIKYHKIHVGLISELAEIGSEFGLDFSPLNEVLWKCGIKNPGIYWVLNANFTFGLIHFILLYSAFTLFPVFLRVIWFK